MSGRRQEDIGLHEFADGGVEFAFFELHFLSDVFVDLRKSGLAVAKRQDEFGEGIQAKDFARGRIIDQAAVGERFPIVLGIKDWFELGCFHSDQRAPRPDASLL